MIIYVRIAMDDGNYDPNGAVLLLHHLIEATWAHTHGYRSFLVVFSNDLQIYLLVGAV